MRSNDVKSRMKKAMISLLKKKNYLQITVTDLVQEAGVARASFYRVYTSIDKVLDDVFSELKDELLTTFVPYYKNKDTEKLKVAIIAFLESVKNKNFPTIHVLPENRQYLTPKFESQFINYKDRDFENLDDKYKLPLSLSIVFSLSMIWAYYNFSDPVDVIADYIIKSIY